MALTIDKQVVINFKDNRYTADQLGHQSSSGPMIEISSDDLHPDFTTNVSFPKDMPEELQKRSPVFAKYEGKYVVLLGLGSVMESCRKAGEGQVIRLKGRLLSNPMLKRCLV